MKNNNKHRPHQLSEVQFQFRPASVQFKKNYMHKRFRLYLQRQAQIIGQVKTLFLQHSIKEIFTFPSDQQIIPFRVLRVSSSIYQIALYQVGTYDQETFLETAELSLCNYIKDYHKQLLKCEEQLWVQQKNDQKSSTPQIWRTLSNNFTKKTITSTIKFNKIDVQLQINVSARNKYDKQVNIDEQIQKKKKEQKMNGRKKTNEFGKSKTAPSLPEIILPPQTQKQVQSQVVLAKLKSLQPDFGRLEHNLITSLQIPSLKFRLNKIQEVEEAENKAQETSISKKQVRDRIQLFASNQNLDISPVNQELKQQSQFLKNNDKRLEEVEASQFYAINTTQGMKPDIDIKAFKLIPAQEINSTFQNDRLLYVESNLQKSISLTKIDNKNLLIWFSLICFMFLIYWLMHPLSKL